MFEPIPGFKGPMFEEFEPSGGGIPPAPEPAAAPAPEYDEIVYNQEVVKIPVSERKTYLQKGYNYDKIAGRATEYETALQRAAKVTGFSSVDELLSAIAEKEKEAEAAQYQGTDPKMIEELVQKQLSNNPVIKQTQQLYTKTRIAEEKAALQGKKFFKELEPKIDAVLKTNPNLPVETVYNYVKGLEMDTLIENAAKAAAGQAVENHLNQSKRGTETNSNPPAQVVTLDFTASEKEWADRGIKRGTYKDLQEAHAYLRGTKGVKMR